MKIFSFIRQCLQFLFPLYSNAFVCLSFYLSFFIKNIQYYQLSYVIFNVMIHMYMKILSLIRKCIHFTFQLYPKCIYMPIIFSKFCPKNLQYCQLSCIILNFMIYMLYENLLFSSENV